MYSHDAPSASEWEFNLERASSLHALCPGTQFVSHAMRTKYVYICHSRSVLNRRCIFQTSEDIRIGRRNPHLSFHYLNPYSPSPFLRAMRLRIVHDLPLFYLTFARTMSSTLYSCDQAPTCTDNHVAWAGGASNQASSMNILF
ncbi:hypothetical protein OBBRIDRAFT_36407 [Obba rivulosa]|uniref:Uncharacterized protein n=1 Tax=Obba rivulosa TaxID=1052685 RepID=A0A8E2DJL9_9APHY|nr:hypothetical protein OBBRIDRAFT_36407 [Obba rivulosa]